MPLLGKTLFLERGRPTDSYLNPVENIKDGKFKADHTYWNGFPNRTAAGLRLEQRKP
jgi:hypothetical protein